MSDRKDFTVEKIIELFGLSKDRLSYKVEELSWERWRASMAIGFAQGKSIYCFPWCSTMWINDLILNSGIHRCIDIVKKYGSIIIIPTSKTESIEYLVDEVISINNSKSLPSDRAKELVKDYKKTTNLQL